MQPGDLADVATSGAYADLSGAPEIPSRPDQVGALMALDTWETARATNTHGILTLSVMTSLANINGLPSFYNCVFCRDDAIAPTLAAFISADGFKYVPAGTSTPLHYGARGIKSRANQINNGYLLSDAFAALADAQAVFPKATTLAHTLDSLAIQKMVDVQRENAAVYSSGAESSVRWPQSLMSFDSPNGAYVINRMCDLTMIETAHSWWHFVGDRAVFFNQCFNQYAFTFLGSRKGYFHGFSIVNEWVRGQGIPRGGMQFGRPGDGTASDSHFFGAVEVSGKATLGAYYMMAVEECKLGAIKGKNTLDKRNHYGAFDGGVVALSGDPFKRNEYVTWSGGGVGQLLDFDGSVSGTFCIKVLAGALADNVTFTGETSGFSGTVNGAMETEPEGEGRDGEGYVFCYDGNNIFGTECIDDPMYVDHAPLHEENSSLQVHGIIDMRHTGWGSAIFLCGVENIRLGGSYCVSPGARCRGHSLRCRSRYPVHRSSQPLRSFSTHPNEPGIQQGVRIDATNPGTEVTISGLQQRNRNGRMEEAQFMATENVAKVSLWWPEIWIAKTGQNNGQKLFLPGNKFFLYHAKICIGPGFDGYVNLDELGYLSGDVYADDITWAGARRPQGNYRLHSLAVSGFFGHMKILPDDSGVGAIRFAANNAATKAQILYSDNGSLQIMQFKFTNGWQMQLRNDILGLSISGPNNEKARIGPFDQVETGTLKMTNVRDLDGKIVLKKQQAHIPPLPTDGSATTTDVVTKLNAFLAFAVSMGLMADASPP